MDRLYANELNAALGPLADGYVAKYTYGTGANHSRLESVCYGNGGTVHYRYDENNRIVGISYDGGKTDRFIYGYDALGNITFVHDAQSMRTVLYNESSVEVYFGSDLIYFSGIDSEGNRLEYNGGEFVLITKETESARDPETGITASKKEFIADNVRAELLKSTDAFGRTQEKAAVLRNNPQSEDESPNPFAAVVTDYTYHTEKGNTQGRVKAMRSRVTYGTSMVQENATYAYFHEYYYDKNGNISHILDIEDDEADIWDIRYNYEYDEANQLIRVDDNVQKKTFTYQYDKGGNRVSEKIYPYTESDNLGTPEKTVKSLYNYIQWKDRLSSYDGKAIKYDAAGNPVSYGDQKYVWMGKQLTEIINPDGTKTTFAYDADGFRTEKHQIGADGTEEYVVYYIWLNGVLTQQYLLYTMEITIKGEIRRIQVPFFVEFIYDESNQAQGCILNGDAGYLFVRNLQGDVIALADMEGRVMIEYNYDPWGKISYTYFDENGNPSNEIADESLQMITAIFCPLTYRGYNYDFTTGLYYLQSRYYNPEWGRFLNCDDTSILLATQGETHGANLFAYCGNDPINRVDYSGMNSTPHTTGEIIAIKSCLALAIYCQDENNIKKLRNWSVYDIVYFYPFGSQLLQFIFVFQDSWGYYTINALVGTKDEWTTFLDKCTQNNSAYLPYMANAHNNAMLNGGFKTGMEGMGVITAFFGAAYIVGPIYLCLEDRPYYMNVAKAKNTIIAVTRESWDTKYFADRKLKKKKELRGADYEYWYID